MTTIEADGNLETLLSSLYDVRRQKKELGETEEKLLAEIKPLVDSQFDVLPKAPITAGGIVLTRVSGVNRTISADKLLERGVSPEIVAFATKTREYFQYRTSTGQ